MAILGASFQIGRSALAAYQAAIAISGQNIANLGNADYARQSAALEAELGGPILGGVSPGAGVRLAALRRHVDEALESRLRQALGARAGSELLHNNLSQVESMYNELSDQDLSTQLNGLFSAFSGVQTEPGSDADRNLVVAAADGIARTLRRFRTGLERQINDLNTAAESATQQANGLAGQIATLNEQIVNQEASTQSVASPLRDRRDALLRQLSELAGVDVRQQTNGSINVYIGSEPLVEAGRSRGLVAERVVDNGYERAVVRFADTHSSVVLRDGQLAGIVAARDAHLPDQLDQLDTLARGLIYQVNRAHSNGRGLIGYSNTQGSFAALDPNAALNTAAAGLTFPAQNGTFIVHVRNTSTGETITRQIDVDLDGLNGDDTSLSSLAASLSGVPGMTASVTSDNRLAIQAASGSEFWFSDDSSGTLAAVGVGNLFTGTDAATIDVASAVRSDPRLVAASRSGEIGDGDNAGELALALSRSSSLLGGISVQQYQAGMTDRLAVATAGSQTEADAADTVYSALYAQRESISGVSVDEEAINLTKFERAFQGATRFIGILDSLADELLTIVK